jgi:hypothetical protein
MYQFRIKKRDDGGYRFDLGAIKMLVDDYVIKDDKHILTNPGKAIAYFTTNDNIYGLSNEQQHLITAEAFFDCISLQYKIFNGNNTGTPKLYT